MDSKGCSTLFLREQEVKLFHNMQDMRIILNNQLSHSYVNANTCIIPFFENIFLDDILSLFCFTTFLLEFKWENHWMLHPNNLWKMKVILGTPSCCSQIKIYCEEILVCGKCVLLVLAGVGKVISTLISFYMNLPICW